MRIIDKDGILPNVMILEDIIRTHPFHQHLASQLDTVTVRRPSQSEEINVETVGHDIILAVYPFQQLDEWNRYVLYHEIGHIADRFNGAFKYCEETRRNLNDRLRQNFVELWNLYIDARLNCIDIYRHKPGQFLRRLGDEIEFVERTYENQLLERVDFLCKRGFADIDIVHSIWNHPNRTYSFIDLIAIVKAGAGERDKSM